MIRIGVGEAHYGATHVFEGVDVPYIRFIREPYVFPPRITRHIWPWSLGNAVGSAVYFTPGSSPDAYHTFNKLVLNRKPWFVSFETSLPRIPGRAVVRKAFRPHLFQLLARDECRALLAMSKNAALHFEVENSAEPMFDRIMRKVHVVYPGVADNPETYRLHCDRGMSDEIHLVFIGVKFFQKGGMIAVDAYEELRGSLPLKMTVISSMVEHSDVIPTPPESAERYKSRMAELGICYYDRLENRAVRRLLATTDVLLLPTLDDTFGFCVLEAMATGVIPVVTGIRALPELVTHGKDGLIIPVATDEKNRMDISRTSISDIKRGVVSMIRWLVDDRQRMRALGVEARKTYEIRFSRRRLSTDLGDIYRKMLT